MTSTAHHFRYAYNTNGLAHHRLDDAVEMLAENGYAGVALTLDVNHFDPFVPDVMARAEALRARCDALGLGVVIETGAKFLLNPRVKHEPTLVTADADARARRLAYLRLSCDLAEVLGAEAVSFWTGVPGPHTSPEQAWAWAVEGVQALVDSHGGRGYSLAIEPEPGMLVGDAGEWATLHERVPGVDLALDTGHCIVGGAFEPEDAVRAFAPHLGSIALEGMARGVHTHLPLGEGDLDLVAVLSAMAEVGYDKLVTLELSSDSGRANEMIPTAMDTLAKAEAAAGIAP
ncbi:TIM barrel protein [Modestobacter sp. I12A-02628]|uniref:Sugar phosphate isomerase/epimerase n=1 Tax=Goekera deserti TaxID=2497753 RepID=A0A7K3WCS2_9ACTN|nr:sugar phosphate isomerase/epimerase family protein [Goekera deserti]MPQ96992.1 TIM barrel protein [Goekera deserti]NDI46693.1 TIM barrel protein [Goekera deserti]NEL54262.1 sugar phosphate isomerase/epimerase [Goekera deserti]